MKKLWAPKHPDVDEGPSLLSKRDALLKLGIVINALREQWGVTLLFLQLKLLRRIRLTRRGAESLW
jgi:hypothetical protein